MIPTRVLLLVSGAVIALSPAGCKSRSTEPTTSPQGTAKSNPAQPAPQQQPPQPQPADHSEQATPPTPSSNAATAWSFDADSVGAVPAGFSLGLTGSGAPGRWEVETEADAPSDGQVLAQVDADNTDFRFPVAVAEAAQPADVRVTVKCKMISGKVDRACGLVARYADENNYYVTRANALENNVRLYYLKAGKRKQLASWRGEVKAGVWYDYAFELRGDRLQVFWNGTEILDHRDSTFPEGGRIGVWTKADSVTSFDDLRVEPLP